jgi:hypothetical protein
MMQDPEKTIGNIDKVTVSLVGSVDEDGSPTQKLCFLLACGKEYKACVLRQTHPRCA